MSQARQRPAAQPGHRACEEHEEDAMPDGAQSGKGWGHWLGLCFFSLAQLLFVSWWGIPAAVVGLALWALLSLCLGPILSLNVWWNMFWYSFMLLLISLPGSLFFSSWNTRNLA